MTYRIDAAEIRRGLELYLVSDQLTELRAVKCKVQGEYRKGTFSGYYTLATADALIADCGRIERATGVYFMPNPIDPRLHAQNYNRACIVDDGSTTADKHIIARRWLLIDVDPVRPGKISSTAAEKAEAWKVLLDVDNWLFDRGFPPGIISDSGNGWHLCIHVDLPANDGGRVERLLKGLAREFDNEHAKVDVSVFNPAGIWKLPGTLSCKGDNAPEIGREWRMARIVQICNEAQRC